ncbi:anti-sigma factor domain-containing protein [uncultured Friedmanniella sp.]|uniref:anti-sigma factor n=1 Tax=uncultured Friedmanniella sp. TaxID=335381 RepID=UPI0035CC7B6D
MSEIHGATGSYVLHALDTSELDEFEAHLAACATCSREVIEFCETAAELSLLATAPPPAALKGSIMSAISGVRVLPPDPTVAAPNAVPGILPLAFAEPTSAAEVEHLPQRAMPVDELALRRARRRSRLLSLAVAAALVVALAMGGWVVSLKQQQEGQIASATLETQLYSAPDVKTIPIELNNGARGSFVASKSLNRALFTASSLPSPGSDKTYQLWTLKDKAVTPDNLVSGGNGIKQWFRGDIAQSSALAISIEKAGGATSPTDIQKLSPL